MKRTAALLLFTMFLTSCGMENPALTPESDSSAIAPDEEHHLKNHDLNGCSGGWMASVAFWWLFWPSSSLPGDIGYWQGVFNGTCNNHDNCYQHGWDLLKPKSQLQCDNDFLNENYSLCTSLYRKDALKLTDCNRAAQLFYDGVHGHGAPYYHIDPYHNTYGVDCIIGNDCDKCSPTAGNKYTHIGVEDTYCVPNACGTLLSTGYYQNEGYWYDGEYLGLDLQTALTRGQVPNSLQMLFLMVSTSYGLRDSV